MSFDPDDVLRKMLGPGMARQLAEIERIERQARVIEDLTSPLPEIADLQLPSAADMARQSGAIPDPRDICGVRAQLEMSRAYSATDSILSQAMADASLVEESINSRAVDLVQSVSETHKQFLDSVTRPLDLGLSSSGLCDISDLHSDLIEILERCQKAAATPALRAFQDELVTQISDLLPAAPSFDGIFDSMDRVDAVMAPAFRALPQFEDLFEQLNPSAFLEQIDALPDHGHWLSDDLQQKLAMELAAQPSWQELLSLATNSGAGRTATESVRVSAWRLSREYITAYDRTVQDKRGRMPLRERAKLIFYFGAALAGYLGCAVAIYGTLANQEVRPHKSLQPTTPTGPSIKRDRWTVPSRGDIVLRSSPRHGSAPATRLGRGALLLMRRHSKGWVEVDAWDCEGRHYMGWVEESLLQMIGRDTDDGCPVPSPEKRPKDGFRPPQMVVRAGSEAVEAWHTFFQSKLVNANSRQSYYRACRQFFGWCEEHNLALDTISPGDAAAWRDQLLEEKAPTTTRQYLSAVRRLFDWWQNNRIMNSNPVQAVRVAGHQSTQNSPQGLSPSEIVRLFESFDNDDLVGRRDRALVGVMTFALVRVSDAAQLRVSDVDLDTVKPNLMSTDRERGQQEIPLNTTVAHWIREYLELAGIGMQKDSWLFRSFGRGRAATKVTDRPLSRQDIHACVGRALTRAGIARKGGPHALRATGIKLLLTQGTPIEVVARIAGHASLQTTAKYDSRSWQEMRTALSRITT